MAIAVAAVTFSREALGAPQATGDLGAWAEVVGAYTKLNALSGYRARVDSPSEELTADREVIPGRAIHELIHEHKLTLELITVRSVTRHRFIYAGATGAWQCDRTPHTAEPDPTTMQEQVRAVREADAAIAGALVHVVTYSWDVFVAGRYVTRRTTVYIDPTNGLPRRSVSPLVIGPYIIDYYDYGAKIEIVLPPCGS